MNERPTTRPAATAFFVLAFVVQFCVLCVLSLFLFALIGISGWWFLLPPIALSALVVRVLQGK